MACVASRTGRELQRYTSNGGRQVVGCIPYRFTTHLQSCSGQYEDEEDHCIQVLLISSQKGSPNPKMMFPKGGWELDETLEQAAIRESVEEAGVIGRIESQLGEWNFTSNRYQTTYVGYMFPLLVTEELELWPEMDVRERRWVSLSEARQTCQHWWMKHALDRLVDRLALTTYNVSISS